MTKNDIVARIPGWQAFCGMMIRISYNCNLIAYGKTLPREEFRKGRNCNYSGQEQETVRKLKQYIMNINTLTIKAQEALQAALNLARERGQQAVEPLHLLAVLIREDDSLSTFLLGRVGVNVRGLRDEAERAVGSLPRVEGVQRTARNTECTSHRNYL